ncbi:MAG: Gfo/Idh/MocA family oxidoreductase [Ruminococcus sp.]|nr:Gfo/Idh/MocA family oxidoreductase [Ruminococcus sp.]MCM1479749.1 Gfo/Idh/MocA family oxidoreductase [Muribaculaceae bacterium]
MKTTNWGIMATGKIAHTFAKAVNAAEDAKLYACASRDGAKAAAFAEQYGAEKSYGSYEELAADPNVDIVYIASPMSCHRDNVKLCFEHGKNVLCEKSITVNSAQLGELVKIAKEKNLFFMEAMWTKCLPAFLKAKEWVRTGKIGEIKAIRADFSNPVDFNPSDRLFRPELGGGALLDLAVYPITLITSFLGFEPLEISSSVNIGKSGVDTDEAAVFRYKNSFASMTAGFNMENENRAVIVGRSGRIAFDPWFFCTDTVRLFDGENRLLEESKTPHLCNGYEYEILEAQRCLAEELKESPLNPLSDTVGVMKIMDGLRADWGYKFPGE